MTEVLDFWDDFSAAVRADLERGQNKYGDSWLHRPRSGQVKRIKEYFMGHYNKNKLLGTPIKWESIVGEMMIGWIRDNHQELFPDGKTNPTKEDLEDIADWK